MKTPKTTSGRSAPKAIVKPTDAVALPASTTTGVKTEVNVVDALKLADHQNSNLAGDIAAAEVTRLVAAVGAIVEPVNPALATEQPITGDAAGDAAIAAVGAGPEFVQPLVPAISTLRPDNYTFDPIENATLDTPERSATAVDDGAGSTASPAAGEHTLAEALAITGCIDFADLVAMAQVGNSLMTSIEVVTMDGGAMAGWTPAEDPAEIVLDMAELLEERNEARRENRRSLEEALGGEFSQVRITAKVAGFRRGGRAHPAEPVDYNLDDFTPKQIEALLDEPQLVVELL